MSEPKKRFLDIWIVEGNTVYKEVPFDVVTDWIQQGRLLENDMYKPSGTRDWLRFGGVPEFEPYFPKVEPNKTEDQAEALEPVEVDFTYRGHKEDEDDDVDMIPLIDVSLVLLVFFMITATTAAMAAFVDKPEVEHTLLADNPDSLRIDIARDKDAKGNPTDRPLYSIGEGEKPPDEDERDLKDLGGMLARLEARLAHVKDTTDIVINADAQLKSVHVRNVQLALREDRFRNKIRAVYFGAKQRSQ